MNPTTPKHRAVISVLLATMTLMACSQKPEVLLTSAKAYLTNHDNKAAIIQIKNALQIAPNMAEARFLLGSALLDAGDLLGAEAELRKAIELKHPKDAAAPVLAKALLAQGQDKKLINEFAQTALALPGAQASLRMSLATAYAAQGQNDLAQVALNAALTAQPGYAPALLQSARQMASKREYDKAQKVADDVIASTPESHDAWKLKGDIFWHGQGRPVDAVVAYRRAIQLKPDFLDCHASVITIFLQQGSLDEAEIQIEQLRKIAPKHPRVQYLSAQLAYQRKDFKQAKEMAQEVLKTVPRNYQALQMAGAAELELGNLTQAESHLRSALEVVPTLSTARRLLIVTYLRSRQAAKAMEALLPGLEIEPIDPDLLALAGEVYMQSGDINKAGDYLARATKLAPHDPRKKTSLALVHLRSGQVDTAFDELREIAATDNAVTADLALISEHLRRKEVDMALQAINRLDKKQPSNPLVSQLRARAFLANKDWGGARKNYEAALQLDPIYYPAVAGLAQLDLLEKKPDAARNRFDALLAKDPKNWQALLALAELASRNGASHEDVAKLIGNAIKVNPQEADIRLLLIDFYLRNRDTKSASSAAQSAALAMPNNPRILAALGRTQQAAGELNQAIATYNQLTLLLPQSPLPLKRLADAQWEAKDRNAASSSLQKAIAIQPDFLDGQRMQIDMALADGKFQDAIQISRTIQKQRPKEIAGYSLEGDISATQRNWTAAIAAYRAGLKVNNTTALALKLHAALRDSGNAAEANRFAGTWQKEHTNDAAFLFYLADAALARQDYPSAEKYYSAVTQLQPTSAIAFNNLAWVSAKLKKGGAIALAQKAVALDPNQPAFMDTLAMLHSEKGDFTNAMVIQTKALALQPMNPQLKLNMAKISIKAGKKDLAKSALIELIKLGDTFPAQPEVATLLQGL